jgi:hypothetical protein
MDADEVRKARQRERTQKYRAKLRAAGIKPPPKTPEQKVKAACRMAERRRVAAEQGATLPSNVWWRSNPDRHRENVRRYRAENQDRMREVSREAQANRRSTPWGVINNRVWPIMRNAVRSNSSRQSKYTLALGYLWSDLRAHLEAQFSAEMSWGNWGSVWELDHIKPLKLFKYASLDDPLFQDAWRFENLRPLLKHENARKGSKH